MKTVNSRSYLLGLIMMLFIATLALSTPARAAIIDGADQGGRPFLINMSGAEEAPGPGDPDGSGTAFITLNQGLSLVCFELTVENIAPATAAHIHRAAAGVPGPVVVPLSPPVSGFSSGCISADAELIKEIRQSPGEFYVNVHNANFPAGAVRGQLDK